jgi:hypothetical protein
VHWVAPAAFGVELAIAAKWLFSSGLGKQDAMAVKLHFPDCAQALGRRSRSQLLSWTKDAVAANPRTLLEPKPVRKHSLLPVLVVLFLISYGLMSLLVVEQDRTIASQRWLITSLLGDSTELSHLKGKLLQKQYAKAQTEAGSGSQGQTPPTQDSVTQDPSNQDPPTQDSLTQRKAHDAPAGNAQGRNTSKLRKGLPQKPPLGIADIVDGRRIVKTI